MVKNKMNLSKEELLQLQKPKSTLIKVRVCAIVLSYVAICYIILLYPISGIFFIPFLGFILSGFLNAAHFYLHRKDLTQNNRWIIGVIWCIPILANYSSFKKKHLAHHRITGVEGDPDLHPEYKNIFEYLFSHSGIELWTNTFKLITQRLQWKYSRIENEDKKIYIDNYMIVGWLMLIITILFIYPKIILLCYLGPLMCYPCMVVFFSLPEHYGINGTKEIRLNTRSITSINIVRFFQWNANYHAEHHYFPGIPTTNLHQLRNIIQLPYENIENSYIAFHYKLIKNLLKVF